ncbi:MAG: hypothetical protein JW894_00025 [Bacteroidales bacterium]|nr:hypothetical protein [Bacteroidales bacterium]
MKKNAGVEHIKNGFEPEEGTVNVQIQKKKNIPGLPSMNTQSTMGIYNNMIYYALDKQTTYEIVFENLEGSFEKTILINKGKGPGEIIQMLALVVNDKQIYAADVVMQRVNVYDINGNYLNEYDLTNIGDMPVTTTVMNDKLYMTCMLKKKIIKIDLNTMALEKTIEYEEKKEIEVGGEVIAGGIRVDEVENQLVYVFMDYPIQFEIYNTDLVLKKIVTKKSRKKKNLVWGMSGNIVGDMAAMSFYAGKGYYYVPTGYHISGTQEPFVEKKPQIHVFDKTTGQYKYDLVCEQLGKVKGGLSIIGEIDNTLIFHLLDTKDNFSGLVFAKNPIKSI